jgi:hypothetical protein
LYALSISRFRLFNPPAALRAGEACIGTAMEEADTGNDDDDDDDDEEEDDDVDD